MIGVVGAMFLWALCAPILFRRVRAAHWLLAAAPAAAFASVAAQLPRIEAGEVLHYSQPWVSFVEVDLALRLDGLSATFALLITGIGTLIVIYTGGYFSGKPRALEFQSYLLVFTASMLTLVLADNIVILYIAWELTTLSSYALIGFEVEEKKARHSARQSLLVTSGAGLAMLAGLLLAAGTAGSFSLSEINASRDALHDSGRYPAALLLISIGAIAKSAIFPFHFWLPNAMVAPTPASAFLHSATMVKAGLYLLARLRPGLGDTDLWFAVLAIAGALTVLVAGARVLAAFAIKAVLANTTLIALGTLLMLLALPGIAAVHAFATYLVAHALYKAPLFLVAGVLSKSAGIHDVRDLRRVVSVLLVATLAALAAALAQMGIFPLFGFVAKELVYEAVLHAPRAPALWVGVAVWGFALNAAGALFIVWPMLAGKKADEDRASKVPVSMWLGAALLAVLGIAFGPLKAVLEAYVVNPLGGVTDPAWQPARLKLWAGIEPPLLLSVASIGIGIGGLALRRRYEPLFARLKQHQLPTLERLYDAAYSGLLRSAARLTELLQNGRLIRYTTAVVASVAAALCLPSLVGSGEMNFDLQGARVVDFGLAGLIVSGVIIAATARDRLLSVMGVSLVGLLFAGVFALIGAPDVALTQFAVETLLLLVVLITLSGFKVGELPSRSTTQRTIHGLLATAVGIGVTAALLLVLDTSFESKLSERIARISVPEAHSQNLVNAILVDFRAFDTLGEIAVLAAAGLSVSAALQPVKGRHG